MLTLGIESSCDDTAAAVLQDDNHLLATIVSSQNEIHSRYGGVVPELASRQHLQAIEPIVAEALLRADKKIDDIDLIAVTQGPGLIGSLLVGFCYAKAISHVGKIPYVGVDHMAGHLLSIYLEEKTPTFPYIALIVSGGNTSIFLCKGVSQFKLLGRTRDDAAGEAFDKVAKLLEIGYPGGPIISDFAKNGDNSRFSFPRAWLEKNSLDFSFSGLKTAVLNQYNKFKDKTAIPIEDICSSFQQAVVDVLVVKTVQAAQDSGVKTVVMGGGVSANNHLRLSMLEECNKRGIQLFIPQPEHCTDNAAMIAMAGYLQYRETGKTLSYSADVFSRSLLG